MAVGFSEFYAACPGVVPTPDMMAALAALPAGSAAAAIQAAILPLMPEGDPPLYTAGAPAYPPTPMPGGSPLVPAALPPQPDVLLPIGANPAFGVPDHLGTIATFARGLPLFADSNPAPLDGWSIEFAEDALA